MEIDQDEIPTASWWMWLLLIVIASISFWCQATVTEERLVPALNVISNKFNIPDDIAGATLMAAGASSPELFSSFVALFITHSSLGLGTVFGSEVFNQLIICAGAVYSSKTGRLELNKAVVTREVSFYALGILALYLALQDTEPVDDDPSGIDHISISFWNALLVFSGYIFYVLVCANMDAIVNFVTSMFATSSSSSSMLSESAAVRIDESVNYGTIHKGEIIVGDDLPFLQQTSGLIKEPAVNFETVELHRTMFGDKSDKDFHFADEDDGEVTTTESSGNKHTNRRSMIEQGLRSTFGQYSDGAQLRPFTFLMSDEKPSDGHDLLDIEENKYEERMSCFMWQRSFFYNQARFAMHGWHLRWFSMMHDQVYSVPDRTDFDRHKLKYPPFTEIVIDQQRLVIKIINPESTKQRDFYLLAPSSQVFQRVVAKLSEIMEVRRSGCGNNDGLIVSSSEHGLESHDDCDFQSLIEFPVGTSNLTIIFYFLLLPFRALIHWTVPDVRTMDEHGNPNSSLFSASVAVCMCLVWLIVGSYAMVASLEALAGLMNIPDAVIGYTVSAAGTSLPNYVASAVAARNGFGNMAVSNALGSNTFNIMIGLGLPWVLYTSFGTGFQPYDELRNEGITEGVVILGAILLLLVLLLLQSGFVLHMWHGHLFVLTYVGYLVYIIGGVYFW